MTANDERHQQMLTALRTKQLTRLFVRQYRETHYLVIVIGDTPYVYAGHTGRKNEYSHVSQIQSWLKDSFVIGETLTIEARVA